MSAMDWHECGAKSIVAVGAEREREREGFVWAGGVRGLCGRGPDARKPSPALLSVYGISDVWCTMLDGL